MKPLREINLFHLPEYMNHYDHQVATTIKVGLCITDSKEVRKQPGCTSISGYPDVPADRTLEFDEHYVTQSPYDGYSYIGQLNLAELADYLPAECPKKGMLWVYFQACGDYDTDFIFDPRDPSEIKFLPNKAPGSVAVIEPQQMLPWSSPETTPWFAWDEHACKEYDDFVQKQLMRRCDDHVQVGGWAFCCQGDFDHNQEGYVATFHNVYFGDCGEVNVWYRDGKFVGSVDQS